MGNDTDNRSIFLHLLKLQLNFLLASITVKLESILGESLLLALAPVLVEPSPHFFAKMLSPNSVECAEAMRSLHICHKPNNDKRRGFNDGNSLTGFLLVEF
jgi:hypothetical protein